MEIVITIFWHFCLEMYQENNLKTLFQMILGNAQYPMSDHSKNNSCIMFYPK